jgi:hypothetical protein
LNEGGSGKPEIKQGNIPKGRDASGGSTVVRIRSEFGEQRTRKAHAGMSGRTAHDEEG